MINSPRQPLKSYYLAQSEEFLYWCAVFITTRIGDFYFYGICLEEVKCGTWKIFLSQSVEQIQKQRKNLDIRCNSSIFRGQLNLFMALK